MSQIIHQEWRDSNQNNPYPFEPGATLTSLEGRLLPEGAFVDAALYPIGGGFNTYLSRVTVTQDTVTLYIGDDSEALRAWGSFSILDPSEEIALADTYARPAGILVGDVTQLGLFQAWGLGTYNFRSAGSKFVARVVVPVPEVGVRGILLDDGTLLTGDVWLVGDDGVVLRKESVTIPATADDPATVIPVIRVDVVGDPLFRRRLCDGDSLFDAPKFIESVKMQRGTYEFTVVPDAQGQIQMLVGDNESDNTILRIRNQGSALQIETVGTPL